MRFDIDNGNDEVRYFAFGSQHHIFAMASRDVGCAYIAGFG